MDDEPDEAGHEGLQQRSARAWPVLAPRQHDRAVNAALDLPDAEQRAMYSHVWGRSWGSVPTSRSPSRETMHSAHTARCASATLDDSLGYVASTPWVTPYEQWPRPFHGSRWLRLWLAGLLIVAAGSGSGYVANLWYMSVVFGHREVHMCYQVTGQSIQSRMSLQPRLLPRVVLLCAVP